MCLYHHLGKDSTELADHVWSILAATGVVIMLCEKNGADSDLTVCGLVMHGKLVGEAME